MLVILSATDGGLSIISFATVIEVLVGMVSASFTLIFSLTTGIVEKLLSTTGNIKKKHYKTFVLATSKLNTLRSLIDVPSPRLTNF